MYNANKPSDDDLPSSGQLLKSTLIALGVAAVILVTAVLPGEYGIDPTGAGRVLGLTQMGELKTQLAEEAAADTQAAVTTPPPLAKPAMPAIIKKAQAEPVVVETAKEPAPKAEPVIKQVAAPAPVKPAPRVFARSDDMTIKLKPGQGAEIKMEMRKGEKVKFHWTGNGGGVNYDTHGDPYNAPRNFYHGYGKGRATLDKKGELEAAFDGHHGWFWRNRTKADVTVTLRVEGNYIAIKRVL
ncbi:MAG: transmembrane anchor protein [Rhodospirillales bacterium]|nr:transmembrane anchor protein [Rhodospirillales bacterium]